MNFGQIIHNTNTHQDFLDLCIIFHKKSYTSLDSSKLWVFKDDNARSHRADRVEHFKQDNNVLSLPWPPQSPDLNPIENLWDELERRVRKCENIPRSRYDLFAALKEEWYQIDIETLANLVDSMSKRIDAVKKSKDYPANY